jgi:hypothetical protein
MKIKAVCLEKTAILRLQGLALFGNMLYNNNTREEFH